MWEARHALDYCGNTNGGARAMKYPKWKEYSDGAKWRAISDEVALETHNGTTKLDFINIVRFLAGEAMRLQARIYELEAALDEEKF